MCKVFDNNNNDQPNGNDTKETCDVEKKCNGSLVRHRLD
jgi:hypothetical protein